MAYMEMIIIKFVNRRAKNCLVAGIDNMLKKYQYKSQEPWRIQIVEIRFGVNIHSSVYKLLILVLPSRRYP